MSVSGTRGRFHVVTSVSQTGRRAGAAGDVSEAMPVEDAIIAVFVEVLESAAEVNSASDFFEIGGDSILAARVIARMRRLFDMKLSMRDIFGSGSPAGLAEIVASRATRRAK
jgi:acyl carrier protein